MSLSMLVGGGAECGPSNPLQTLSKRFDQDRGVQDIAGPSRSRGPLGEVHFRSQLAPTPELQQEAARFFGPAPAPAPHMSQVPVSSSMIPMPAQPFDVTALRSALPAVASVPVSVQRMQMGGGAVGGTWAADFLAGQPAIATRKNAPAQFQGVPGAPMEQQKVVQSAASPMGGVQGGALPWSPVYANYGIAPMTGIASTKAVPVQRHLIQSDQISWDKGFQSQESLMNARVPVPSDPIPEQHQQSQLREGAKTEVPPDEMAMLAAQVIDSVKHEQNPKFRDSEFMQLMRQLRDGEVMVEKDAIVPKDASPSAAVDMKGKGRAVNTHDDLAAPSSSSRSHVHHSYQGSKELNAAYVQQAKDPHEAYFRQENAEFTEYWNAHYTGPAPQMVSAQQEKQAWHEMQRDWDAFEATATGIKPVSNYQFQMDNPYLLGESRTRNHTLHMSYSQRAYESVLELEAAVQRDPTNVAAWFQFGVKQQENEREAKAIQALERAVELDPSHLPAWLALSVSHTNDNHRLGAYDAVREWALRNPKYGAIASASTLATDKRGDFAGLIGVLIRMARSADQGDVDADVQVALAVLLNATGEYGKAVDCFLAALAARPDDWLLYNRVGATMANNGQAVEAIEYYLQALALNPAYIRARFNLGISCIKLRRYEEAASHILDALVLQDSDGVQDRAGMNDARGVTSSMLWESLKTLCLHLQRADLASMCDLRDLNGFRKAFHGGRDAGSEDSERVI